MAIDKAAVLRKIYGYFGSEKSTKPRLLKKWLSKLVELNDPEAMLILSGIQRKHMSDVSFEMHRLALVRKAASLGFPPAVSHLAEIYYNKGDYKNAYLYYEKAAVLGDSHALKVLSNTYELGLYGYDKNLELAKKYAKEAKVAKSWDPFSGYDATESIFDSPHSAH